MASRDDPEAYWRVEAEQLPCSRRPALSSTRDLTGWPIISPMEQPIQPILRLIIRSSWSRRSNGIIYDSPVTHTIKHFSYREVLAEVEQVAGALSLMGVGPGDRVIIYLPMVPEAAFAMLACARLGAIHSVVFGGSPQRIGH